MTSKTTKITARLQEILRENAQRASMIHDDFLRFFFGPDHHLFDVYFDGSPFAESDNQAKIISETHTQEEYYDSD